MIGFRYAYLYKNGKQTSCMVAVIDMTAGVVAANCIDLTSDNKVDTSVKYKIHYTPYGNNTGPMFDLSPSEFTIHPDYDPKTLLNNIAVIQNTNGGTDDYSSYISTKDFDVISKGEKIAIGVAVPLGVILLIVGAIIVHHIWKINRQDKAWDPAAETWNMQDIAIDIRADEMNIPSPFAQMNMHDNLFVIHADTSAESKK
ncbi:hypothetical protein H4S06_000894 [Coemansia sp. BCRC 34490]|nr:hypothetical protein H4S06_000894 [Coemansia sp. BCRC 34490]